MADRDEEVAAALVDEYSGDDLIESIAFELRAAREEARPKWQTIDTAPRDQRIIVGRAAVRAGTATLPAYSGEAFWSESKQAWCFHSEWFGHPVMEYDNPTHWMPTPTPPGDDK